MSPSRSTTSITSSTSSAPRDSRSTTPSRSATPPRARRSPTIPTATWSSSPRSPLGFCTERRRFESVKLSMTINYSGDFHADVRQVQALEQAGLDLVWVPEAYSFDSVSLMGYMAAKTDTIQIGSGILNVFSRTASCIAQTAAGLDFVSDGRFVLGLGASGPQVIEGFHGVPYDKPMPRIRDYINICRMVWRREPVIYDGTAVRVPLPAGEGTGLA